MNVEGGGCTEGDGECPLNHSYGGTGSAWRCVGSPKGCYAHGNWLRYKRAMVGTEWANSHRGCMNKHRKRYSHLLGA